MSAEHILVIGSSNTDMVIKSPRLPGAGETILGGDFFMNPGGKGANQAVAAAKLNGKVTFLAKVGTDIFGDQAIDGFKNVGIDTSSVLRDPKTPSGVALIMVDGSGENSISVALGANGKLSPEDISAKKSVFEKSTHILIQLEIPIETVEAACKMGAELGKKVILNPAPAQDLSDAILQSLFLITPNETEAQLLTGVEVHDEASAASAAKKLQSKGVNTVIITLGSKGAYVLSEDFEGVVDAPVVEAVDTTAAGDTFNGALTVALSEGMSLKDAVIFANRAGAYSVTKLGAQSSAPSRNDIA